MLRPPAAAPAFESADQDARPLRLGDLAGRWAIVYFYSRDDTPGCTKEACEFRDHHRAIQALGAVVLGVSGDSGASHRKFIEKYGLPFALLVDGDHAIAKAFGVWGLKNQYGRKYEGVIRSTFAIDPQGRVAHVWPRVRPDGHGREVLAWLEANVSK